MATITPYGPPTEVSPLGAAMDRLLREAVTWPRFVGEGYPVRMGLGLGFSANLYETKDAYIAQMALPGVKVETLTITAREAVLAMHGTTEIAVPEGAQGIWVGLTGGEFREEFALPGEVAAEKATATYQDGILTLVLPKAAHARAMTIKVGVTQG